MVTTTNFSTTTSTQNISSQTDITESTSLPSVTSGDSLSVAQKDIFYSHFKIFCTGVTKLWNFLTYPISLVWTFLSRSLCFFYLTFPLRFVHDKIQDLFDAIHYKCDDYFEPREKIFSEEDIERIRESYWILGSDKWKEGIDGRHHHLGKRVYDFGFHSGTVEPGFIRSWERAAHFLSYHIGEKVTPDLYLETHALVCGHFNGAVNGVLMGGEKVGVFRNEDDHLINGSRKKENITPEAERELNALPRQPSRMVEDGDVKKLRLTEMSRNEIRNLLSQYLNDFYQEIEQADDNDKKFEAISRLQVRLEFLHATRDGSTRTNLLLINFLLCHYLDHPALIDDPNDAPWKGTLAWKENIVQSWENWQNSVASIA